MVTEVRGRNTLPRGDALRRHVYPNGHLSSKYNWGQLRPCAFQVFARVLSPQWGLPHHSACTCSPCSSSSIVFPSFINNHIKSWEEYLSYLSTQFYRFRCSPSLYLHYISKVTFYNVRGSPVFHLFSFCLENFPSCFCSTINWQQILQAFVYRTYLFHLQFWKMLPLHIEFKTDISLCTLKMPFHYFSSLCLLHFWWVV